ncbi:MAG: PAS domain S-box protein, partial [Acidobacteriota bacterium]|nr:PAS domain S-box protein [Acidobacteriota bacterium]
MNVTESDVSADEAAKGAVFVQILGRAIEWPRLDDTVPAMTDFKRNGGPGTIELPLERILDGISDAISLLDRDWRYTHVNAQAEILSGLKKEQLLGRSIWEVFPAAIGSEFETSARRAVEEQRQISFEYHSPTFGRWFEQRLYPTPQGLLFFTTDIDNRKRLDEQVRAEEKRYQQLFEMTNDGILIVDDEGRYVDVNASFCKALKAPRERLIGAHFSEFIPAGRLDEAIASFADLKAGRPTLVEFPLKALDGSIVDLEWSSFSHYLPNLSFCICRDRTERRGAQAALQASEERQRRAVEAGKVGLWEWDIDGARVTWSDYIYELHGLPPGTFGGTVEAFAALIDPRDKDWVSDAMEKALAGQAEYHVEFRAARPDGQTKWLETSGEVAFDANGRPIMMYGAVIDTTARREAEEAQRALEGQLMLLVEASGALLASPHSAEVLRTIIELAQRFVSADAHAVWRWGQDNIWRLRSSLGLSPDFVTSGVTSASGAPTLPPQPLVVEDISREPLLALRHEALLREGVRSMLAIPLHIQGQPSGTVVFYWKAPHKFTESEIRIASALGNLAASALSTAELYDKQLELSAEARAAEQRAAFLAEAGALLSSSLDYDATLTSVVNLAIPVFADWASVDVLDKKNEIRRVAVAHKDPDKILFAHEFGKRYPPREDDASLVVLRTGKSILVEDISDELIVERAVDAEHLRLIRELGLKSVIIAPMVMNGRSLGIISFVTAESGRRYSAADLQTAEELARRAATALENARLYNESQQSQAELQEKNKELRRVNDDLNQFAYSASHDLQEPLRMVSIYSQLLKKRYANQLDSTADQYLEYTVGGARRMEALLRDILAYTQAANSGEEESARVDASQVLEKALANLQSAIAETGARISTEKLPMLRIQEIHLLQLFQNLIGNAIKYRSKEAPLIQVSAKQE